MKCFYRVVFQISLWISLLLVVLSVIDNLEPVQNYQIDYFWKLEYGFFNSLPSVYK